MTGLSSAQAQSMSISRARLHVSSSRYVPGDEDITVKLEPTAEAEEETNAAYLPVNEHELPVP